MHVCRNFLHYFAIDTASSPFWRRDEDVPSLCFAGARFRVKRGLFTRPHSPFVWGRRRTQWQSIVVASCPRFINRHARSLLLQSLPPAFFQAGFFLLWNSFSLSAPSPPGAKLRWWRGFRPELLVTSEGGTTKVKARAYTWQRARVSIATKTGQAVINRAVVFITVTAAALTVVSLTPQIERFEHLHQPEKLSPVLHRGDSQDGIILHCQAWKVGGWAHPRGTKPAQEAEWQMVHGGKGRREGLNVRRVGELTWSSAAEARPPPNTRTEESHFPHRPFPVLLFVSHLSCGQQTSHLNYAITYLLYKKYRATAAFHKQWLRIKICECTHVLLSPWNTFCIFFSFCRCGSNGRCCPRWQTDKKKPGPCMMLKSDTW